MGMQGWHTGMSTRLPLLWPGFNSWTWHHMWVEFVVGSRPCSKVFSPGFPGFIPPQIPTLQIPIRCRNEGHRFVSFAGYRCHHHRYFLIPIFMNVRWSLRRYPAHTITLFQLQIFSTEEESDGQPWNCLLLH